MTITAYGQNIIEVASLAFAVGAASVSISQPQDLTAAGAAWSVRAQQGALGFVGGTMTIGGGDGGTAGTNLAGDTRVSLGTAVANASAKLQLLVGGSSVLDLWQISASVTSIQSTQQININATGAWRLQVGGVTYVDVGSTVTGAVCFTTSNDVWFGPALTAAKIAQRQHASAAGNPFAVRGQQGALGFIGGLLTIGGGDGGTPGTNLAGGTDIQIGQLVGGTSAKCRILANATSELEFYVTGANTIIDHTSAATQLLIRATNNALQFASSVSQVGFTAAGTVAFSSSTAALVVNWSNSTNVLIRQDGMNAAGATVYTHQAGVTAVSWLQVQNASGVGATLTFRAQRGFAGFIGGVLTLGGGDGGTSGTNLAGATNIELGALVGGLSALCSFTVAAADFGSIQAITAGLRINAASAKNIEIQASGGANAVQVYGGLFIELRTTQTRLEAANQTIVGTFEHIVAGSFFTMAVATPWVFRQTARSTDAATNPFEIQAQAPFASATGTNRNPGNFIVTIAAPAAGGTEGQLRFQLGGSTGCYLQKHVLGFSLIWENNGIISCADSAGGVNGYGIVINAGGSAAVGARVSGGDVSISGGDGRGNSGAGAKGGTVGLFGGIGSTNDGDGGDVVLVSGNGGASTNTDAGTLILGTGIPQGSGVKGEIQFWQGGLSGGVSVKVAYFDTAGQLHVGPDADVTNVNLRVNGAIQTTVGGAGGANPLPATPTKYIKVNANGTVYVVPAYAPV